MAKKTSSSIMASAVVSSKVRERNLCLEAEVSRCSHQVSVLSKRIHKPDPPRRKLSHPGMSPSPVIGKDVLRSCTGSGGQDGEKDGVPEELPPVASDMDSGALAVVLAEDVAMATFEAGAVTIVFCGKRRRLENEKKVVDEDIVIGGKILPLEAFEQGRVEVVEVESSTVVPQAPRVIQLLREGEVVQGGSAGP